MHSERAIALLKKIEPAIRALGVSALYLFGSTARDEANTTSDVDLFFDREPDRAFGLIELVGLEDLLRETLGTEVDVASRQSLHPVLKPAIERTAIRVL